MSIETLVGFVQAAFSHFNVVILIVAVVIATGVLWQTYPDSLAWALLTTVVFVALGLVAAYAVDGLTLRALVLEGSGGRGTAIGYGIGISVVVVVFTKAMVKALRRATRP